MSKEIITSEFDPNDSVSYDFKNLTREEVKEVLNDTPIGTFLLRNSIRDLDQKVLCVKEAPNLINSYKILKKPSTDSSKESDSSKKSDSSKNPDKPYYIYGRDDLSFENIPDILKFYSAHYLNQSPLIKPAFYHKKVVALHDYLQNNEDPFDDLFFRKGEILKVLDISLYDKWWKAMNKENKVGLIPIDFVQRLSFNDPRLNDSNESTRPESNASKIIENLPSKTDEKYSNEQIYGSGEPIECPFNAKVIDDYTPSPYEKSHIRLKKGQIVKVLEMKEMGKWYGELNNMKGLFPFNRVEIINEN